MSDDLVRRAREWDFCWPSRDVEMLVPAMADCIEELESQLKTVLDRETETIARYDAKLDAVEAKLAVAISEMENIDAYLTRLQTPNTEPLNSVNSCGNKKGRGQYTAMVRNEAREFWASLGNTLAKIKGDQP